MRRWGIAIAVALVGLAGPAATADSPFGDVLDSVPIIGVREPHPAGDPVDRLREILDLTPPPEFRRFGSPGMAAVADHLAEVLADAGYETTTTGGTADRWRVDYSPGHQPMLRLADGTLTHVESGFWLDDGVTGPEGVTCRLVPAPDVAPGECGFVDFATASPEWKNEPFAAPRSAIDGIIARGGVGAVVQGDVGRGLVFALQVRRPLPTVVAVVDDTVLGQNVTLRAMGAREPAQLHNVVALRPPAAPDGPVVALLAHADAWFQGAVDNGGGSAAVLAVGERLATLPIDVGVLVMLVDGEEVGLLGSGELADDMADGGLVVGTHRVDLDSLAAVVNLDASSAKPSDVHDLVEPVLGDTRVPIFSWRVIVTNAQPLGAVEMLTPFVLNGALGLPVTDDVWLQISGGGWRTDAEHFADRGVPVVWPVAGYPEYHTDGDTADRVDVGDLRALVDAAVDVVRSIDAAG